MITLNNTNNIDDWIFWLSYESDEEKERKRSLSEKRVKECSFEELKELFKYREYEHMIPLLNRYKTNVFSDDEYIEVVEFLRRPIIDIMIDKTPKDMLESIKNALLELKGTSDFSSRIKSISSKENISIEDRFIKYAISGDRTHYLKSLRDINNSLSRQKRINFNN